MLVNDGRVRFWYHSRCPLQWFYWLVRGCRGGRLLRDGSEHKHFKIWITKLNFPLKAVLYVRVTTTNYWSPCAVKMYLAQHHTRYVAMRLRGSGKEGGSLDIVAIRIRCPNLAFLFPDTALEELTTMTHLGLSSLLEGPCPGATRGTLMGWVSLHSCSACTKRTAGCRSGGRIMLGDPTDFQLRHARMHSLVHLDSLRRRADLWLALQTTPARLFSSENSLVLTKRKLTAHLMHRKCTQLHPHHYEALGEALAHSSACSSRKYRTNLNTISDKASKITS